MSEQNSETSANALVCPEHPQSTFSSTKSYKQHRLRFHNEDNRKLNTFCPLEPCKKKNFAVSNVNLLIEHLHVAYSCSIEIKQAAFKNELGINIFLIKHTNNSESELRI